MCFVYITQDMPVLGRSYCPPQLSHANSNTMSLGEKTIIDESRRQVDMDDAAIQLADDKDLQAIKSQYCCQSLLRKCFSASYDPPNNKSASWTSRVAEGI